MILWTEPAVNDLEAIRNFIVRDSKLESLTGPGEYSLLIKNNKSDKWSALLPLCHFVTLSLCHLTLK